MTNSRKLTEVFINEIKSLPKNKEDLSEDYLVLALLLFILHAHHNLISETR